MDIAFVIVHKNMKFVFAKCMHAYFLINFIDDDPNIMHLFLEQLFYF